MEKRVGTRWVQVAMVPNLRHVARANLNKGPTGTSKQKCWAVTSEGIQYHRQQATVGSRDLPVPECLNLCFMSLGIWVDSEGFLNTGSLCLAAFAHWFLLGLTLQVN